jgi:hypothetical protein
VAGGRRSLELGLAAASGHSGLPWRHGRQEGDMGILVVGSPRAEGRRGGLVAVGSEDERGGVGRGCGTPFIAPEGREVGD